MAPPPPAAGQQMAAVKAKRLVVVALTATLAVATVVTVFSVVLSPPRVHLSVTYARRISSSSSSHGVENSGGGVVELHLTLAANNTSQRAAVVYESMFVDLTNSTDDGSPELEYYVRADLTTAMPLTQRRGSVATFSATLVLVPGSWTDSAGSLTTANRFSVVVTAVARFKVGVARTRLFDIKLACRPVSFFPVDVEDDHHPANKLSGAADGLLPVDCV